MTPEQHARAVHGLCKHEHKFCAYNYKLWCRLFSAAALGLSIASKLASSSTMAEEEKRPLYSSEKEEEGYGSGSSTSLEGEEAKPLLPDPSVEVETTGFFHKYSHLIPGYATLQLLRKARPYALYVLFAMLIAYLLNQLDRYTLPITATSVGIDLRYGDKSCMVNPSVTSQMLNESRLHDNFTATCTSNDYV